MTTQDKLKYIVNKIQCSTIYIFNLKNSVIMESDIMDYLDNNNLVTKRESTKLSNLNNGLIYLEGNYSNKEILFINLIYNLIK